MLGFALIFLSALGRELGQARREKACLAGDLGACMVPCSRGAERACEVLERRCASGIASACMAAQAAKDARKRGSLW